MTTIDRILRELAESAILGGIEVEDDGLRLWIGDKAKGIRAETVIRLPNRFVSEMSLCPAAEAWFTQVALTLYPASPFSRIGRERAMETPPVSHDPPRAGARVMPASWRERAVRAQEQSPEALPG
jgi:hypothetical protein